MIIVNKLFSLYQVLTLVLQIMYASKPGDHVLPPFDQAMYTALEYKQAYEHILNNKPLRNYEKIILTESMSGLGQLK